MDWIAALCLSVPPSVALVVATRLAARPLRDAITYAADRVANVTYEALALRSKRQMRSARNARVTARNIAKIAARATVKAARYQARAIVPRPKPQQPGTPSIFDQWLAREGKDLPESVQMQCEWAIGRLRGTESNDQGTLEDARTILAHFAPGVAKAVEDEVAAAATKG